MRVETRIAVPGGVWRSAFSSRLIVRRCSSSRAPIDDRRVDVERDLVVGAHRPELAGRLDDDLGEIARLARDHARGVGARQQQQVGDQPAHALRGAQRRARRLALVAVQRFGEQLEVGEHARQRRAQLVRGVGHELALAGEHRLGLRAGGVELAQHSLQRARELGDLVVGLRLGHAAGGVARARDLGGGRGELAIGAIARRAIAIPASSASRLPASTPSTRNSSTRLTVASVSDTRRPYWMITTADRARR